VTLRHFVEREAVAVDERAYVRAAEFGVAELKSARGKDGKDQRSFGFVQAFG